MTKFNALLIYAVSSSTLEAQCWEGKSYSACPFRKFYENEGFRRTYMLCPHWSLLQAR